MKRFLLPSIAVSSLMLFTLGCGEQPPVTVPLSVRLKAYRTEDLKAEEAARDAAMAREIAGLEAEAEKLRQVIGREQLAMDRAALEKEERRLDGERAAWLKEQAAALTRSQAAASAKPPTAAVLASVPMVQPAVRDYSYFYKKLSGQGRVVPVGGLRLCLATNGRPS